MCWTRRSLPAIKPRACLKSSVDDDRETCTNCGEACRTGLVRCWNPQAKVSKMRPEIEESYRRMRQSANYEVEHVELPIIDATHVTEEDALRRRVATPDSYLSASIPYAVRDESGGDDFELGEGTELGQMEEDEFDLNQDTFLTDELDELHAPRTDGSHRHLPRGFRKVCQKRSGCRKNRQSKHPRPKNRRRPPVTRSLRCPMN